MEAMLHARFGLDHTTLQVDHAGGELLDIEPAAVSPDSDPGGPLGMLDEAPQRQDRR
jgi:hypothetical protein